MLQVLLRGRTVCHLSYKFFNTFAIGINMYKSVCRQNVPRFEIAFKLISRLYCPFIPLASLLDFLNKKKLCSVSYSHNMLSALIISVLFTRKRFLVVFNCGYNGIRFNLEVCDTNQMHQKPLQND